MKKPFRTATALSLALMVGFALLMSTAAHAQINYQGRLTDAAGQALADGQYRIEFSLWTEATGGEQKWGPYILNGGTGIGHGPLADLVGGRFNVIIGGEDVDGDSLTTAMAASETVYLQIKVGNDDPISPRQIILAAPRALLADVIPHVTPNESGVEVEGDLNVSGNQVVEGLLAAGGLQNDTHVSIVRNSIQGYNDLSTFGNLSLNPNNGNVGIGTGELAPTAKLEVRGEIKLGPSGQYQATSSEENLRIVRGVVRGQSANGFCTVDAGTSFSASRTNGGVYQVDFDSPFTGIPAVTVTAYQTGPALDSDVFVSIAELTTTGVRFEVFVDAGSSGQFPRDTGFTFIAIGPR